MVILNKWNITILTFVFFLTCCTIFKPKIAEETSVDYDIAGKFDLVEIDKLNFVYTQSENNLLRRHTLNSKVKVDYVDNRLGKIDDLDPFDPLNILIFYKSYGIAKVMDNTLNVIKIINFREFSPYQNITQMCASNDGKYWIFDESIQKILKIDGEFMRLAETNRLSDLGINRPQIIKMRESNNQLFVLVDGVGILVFDNFGQFLRKIVVPPVSDFSLVDGTIFYYNQNTFYKVEGIDTRKLETEINTGNPSTVTSVKLNKQLALLWYRGGVNVKKLSEE
jgi:hypothetical protein